ncbi:hypothetical protein PspLS_03456 [Pyricularia sp. CBS 133598]|nr:hypothetical protein PspLS_03456 [Pyricularia sp. CBS 133598]
MPKLQVAPSDRRTRSQAHGRWRAQWVRGKAGESLVMHAGTEMAGPSTPRGNEDEDDDENEYHEDQDDDDEEDYDGGEHEDLAVEQAEAEDEQDESEGDEDQDVDHEDQDEDRDEDEEMGDDQAEEDLEPPTPPPNRRSSRKRSAESVSHNESLSKRLKRGRSTPGASSSSQPPQTRCSSTTVDRSSKDDTGPGPSRQRSKAPSPQPAIEAEPATRTAVRVVIFIRDDDIRGPVFNTINSHCQSVPYSNRQNQFHQPPWTLALADVEALDPELAKYIQHGHGFHQSIVTALHILEEGKKGTQEEKFNVEIRAWADGAVSGLLQEIQNNSGASEDDSQPQPQPQPQPYTIVLIIDTSMNDPTETPKPCDEFAAHPIPNVRVYPCRQEMEGDNGKIHDIYAFEEAAAVTGTADARPTTCFGLSGHQTKDPEPCPLRNEVSTMYKRTWSGFGNHVRNIDGRHLPLTCLPIPRTIAPPPEEPVKKPRKEPKEPTRRNPGRDARKEVSMQTTNITPAQKQKSTPAFTDADFQIDLRETDKATTRRQRWFHQQVVPALKRGEFRVFIGTQKSQDGLRGREGYVLSVVHTATRRDAAQCRDYINVLAVSADEDDDGGNDWMGARVGDVQDFALATFEALRRRKDKGFESLEVGCRLDIGVAEKAVDGSGGGLFVNELTRWYGATYFSSDALALPKTRICARFAKAFADWVRSGGFREAEEWEEE